jgi:hypothetical protein
MNRRMGSIATIVACISGSLAVGSTLRAVLIARQSTPVAPYLAPVRHPSQYTMKSVDMNAFTAAVEANPFHPQRQPGAAFSLPAEEVGIPATDLRLEAAHAIQLIGTAQVAGGRDFVVCQVDAEHPRLVRVGDSCGDRILLRVRSGQAEFEDREGHTEMLFVPGREPQ